MTVVLAREEDAAHTRSYTAPRWVWFTGVGMSVVVVASILYALFAFTPLADVVPLPNPALERKYSRDLVALNQRVLAMLEEMVRLRAYNIRLRNALGEHLSPGDSAVAQQNPPRIDRPADEALASVAEPMAPSASVQSMRDLGQTPMPVTATPPEAVTFPALFPTEGYVTRGYDPGKNHFGLDIAGKRGALVFAAADGAVVFSGWTPDDGYTVIISHPGGYVTFYKHNESLLKPVSARVHRGEAIATLGDSGRTSTGPHLHFEIWKDGVPVDPSQYLLNLSL